MAASLEGVRDNLQPGDPIDVPLYDMSAEEVATRSIERLPRNLFEAATALEKDQLALEVFGPTMHALAVKGKLDEWYRFSEHVTEWEQAEYLQFF